MFLGNLQKDPRTHVVVMICVEIRSLLSHSEQKAMVLFFPDGVPQVYLDISVYHMQVLTGEIVHCLERDENENAEGLGVALLTFIQICPRENLYLIPGPILDELFKIIRSCKPKQRQISFIQEIDEIIQFDADNRKMNALKSKRESDSNAEDAKYKKLRR